MALIEFDGAQHVYQIDDCAGCGVTIAGDYTDVGLPSGNGKRITHIALCPGCSNEAEREGVLWREG